MDESMLGEALRETSGPLEDLCRKLGGKEGLKWLRALKMTLRGENPWPVFRVFKTIKLGTGIKDANGFRKALTDAGMFVSDWASDIMNQSGFTVEIKETEVDLVVVSVAELGFPEGARRDKIYERAQEFGLGLCPAEVGPQLRLQYKDQPNVEVLLIGMEPITASDGSLRVFYVSRDARDQWLHSRYGDPDDVWHARSRWVFVRPRK